MQLNRRSVLILVAYIGNTVTFTLHNRRNITRTLTAAAAQQNDNTTMFLPATTHSHVIVCCEVLATSLKQNANYNVVLLTSMRYIINYNLFLFVFPLTFRLYAITF
jgi:hypothetical protein